MIPELNFLDEWIPEQMEPGTMFLLEQDGCSSSFAMTAQTLSPAWKRTPTSAPSDRVRVTGIQPMRNESIQWIERLQVAE